MTKRYNDRRECPYPGHEGQIAAVCSECYDRALEQQRRQRQAEQKKAHEEYLRRRA